MNLQKIIEKHWYIRQDPVMILALFPFSIIYEIIISIRKLLFLCKILPQKKVRVPVVIIGNITVGGAGKTPLTKYLAQQLSEVGITVGIILRGYKSTTKQACIVSKKDSSQAVGDEALIYAQAGFKVAIGSKRVDAANLLLDKHPEVQLILADDGMQHYYLKRDMEICVIDSSRMFGNQCLLPLGPLREPMSRLKKVDAIVVNEEYNQEQLAKYLQAYNHKTHLQTLKFLHFYNPTTKEIRNITDMQQNPICAMAAIGNPNRFYSYLDKLGLAINSVKSFPDHHQYTKDDIISKYNTDIVTTEKDYTKIAQFKPKHIWVAKVEAQLNSVTLIEQIKQLIK